MENFGILPMTCLCLAYLKIIKNNINFILKFETINSFFILKMNNIDYANTIAADLLQYIRNYKVKISMFEFFSDEEKTEFSNNWKKIITDKVHYTMTCLHNDGITLEQAIRYLQLLKLSMTNEDLKYVF